ncbi:MAG: SurA N-terminal domain-containing protein [Geopsychrobacter sp.]|nr:SurA N-terminal domain-containing protein [Geopsychrobacter sp.]
MKKIYLISLLLLCGTVAQAETLIKTVAIVNNDVVTSYQLEKKLAAAMARDETNNRLDQKQHAELRRKVLNSLIEDRLVEQRIHEIGLSVTDQELNSAIEDVQRQNKLTREQLKTALETQGMSYADYRSDLRKEILRYKLIAREVRSKVEVTNTQIRSYFETHKADYMTQPTLRLGRISYPLPEGATEKTKEQLKQQAQIARQQLLGGKPFDEVLAALGSDVNGGDMGVMTENELSPQMLKGIKGLATGQVSEPMETAGTIHICQILARTPAGAELTPEVSSSIEKILATKNSEKRFSDWKKELRKHAMVDIRI